MANTPKPFWDNQQYAYNLPYNPYSYYNPSNGLGYTPIPNDSYYKNANGDLTSFSYSNMPNQNWFNTNETPLYDKMGNQTGVLTRESWLNQNMGNIMNGLNAGLGILGAYNAFQNRYLAQDQLDLQKDYYNRNIANQAQLINNQIGARARIAAAMQGNRDIYGNAIASTQETRDKYERDARKRYVNGSSIG